MIIEPIFESNFLEGSYGFRPKRSPKDAISAVRKWVYGYSTVIQGAVKLIIEPIFESNFLEGSYGFRPKRRVLKMLLVL